MRLSHAIFNSCLAAATVFAGQASAEDPPYNPNGALFRTITNGAFDEAKFTVLGWASTTAIGATHGNSNLSPGAFFNQDDGLNFNQLGLMACGGTGCPPFAFGPQTNIMSRIGPLPIPRNDGITLGYNVTLLYGEDAQFLRTSGIDDFTSDLTDETRFAIPQAFIDIGLPIADGASLLLGSWQTSLANDIGYPFTPPNWFVTHTYGFQHGPAKHVGGLFSVKIPTPEQFGLLSLEAGVVCGWNNLDDCETHVMGGARWRSPDLRTWIDLEFIFGDGENDAPGASLGGSPYIAVSSTGSSLDRMSVFLTGTHQVNEKLQLGFEASYGEQEGGDVALAPVFITRDSEWYGLNVSGRYKLSDTLHVAGRFEWFRDENAAHVLWSSTGATGGDVYALTAGLEWQATRHLRIRPEIRYDVYDGGGPGLFAGGTEDEQLVGLVNATINF